MSLFPVLSVLPFHTSQAIATGYKCYLSTVVSEKKRSFVIEGNRLLAWAVLPRFCREYSEEALREMRNRSCACGRVSPFSPLLFNFSSLSLVRPGLLTYRRPDADTVLTSSIPGDDDLQFQTNSSLPPSLSFFFSFSPRRSFPHLGLSFARGQMLRSWRGNFKISKLPCARLKRFSRTLKNGPSSEASA